MRSLRFRWQLSAVAAVAVLVLARPASADFVLTVDDPSTAGKIDVIVADNQKAGFKTDSGLTTTHDDGNATAGVLSFNGPVGAFTVQVSTGSSKPANAPGKMDLLSASILPKKAGELIIRLTDTDFDFAPPRPGIELAVGGTVGKGMELTLAKGTYDKDNKEFGDGDSISVGPFPQGAFSIVKAGSIDPITGKYSLTIEARVKAFGSEFSQTGFNASFRVTPEPATLALLLSGAPLLGGCWYWRRRRKERKAA